MSFRSQLWSLQRATPHYGADVYTTYGDDAYDDEPAEGLADDFESEGAAVHAFVPDHLPAAAGAVAPGVEIGRAGDTYRRIRIESVFGKMTVLVTDGHLPYPYGREMTGYEVSNLAETLGKAKAVGVTVLVDAFNSDHRDIALVQFPGGYVAELHAASK